MTRAVVAGCLAIVLGLASHPTAQSPDELSFEVVSVRPSNPDVGGSRRAFRIRSVGDRFTASNVTLDDLLIQAYDVHRLRIVGGPGWRTSRRFDVQAKARAPVAGPAAMRPMLKALLASRFHLSIRPERREMPFSELVVARADGVLGPNIARSTADCSAADEALAQAIGKDGGGSIADLLRAGKGLPCTIMPARNAAGDPAMRSNGQSMAALAMMLTAATDRVVEDRTGLSGLYDWELVYDRRSLTIETPPPPRPSDHPSLLTALREQLGLQLKSTRGPIEVLVIDRAALPDPD